MAVFRRTRAHLDPAAAAAIAEIVSHPKYELIPLRSVDEQIEHLPPGASVTVTASPSKTIEDTVELAVLLHERGFSVVPHLAARMIADRAHLQSLLDAISTAGIDRTFVVGGDASEPGEYLDARSLLRDMDELGHPFREIGIGCYPEGHAVIPRDVLLQALRDKAPHADYMTTQMCFDPAVILDWVSARRSEGIELPVHLGVPGVADVTRLIRVSARIGIGDSTRFLSKNTQLLGRLVKPGGFAADGLLDGLASAAADPAVGIVGLHIFTFNEVATTEAWRGRYLEQLHEDQRNGGEGTA